MNIEKKEIKERIVKGLNDRFCRAKIVILTDYKGLNVEALNSLRRKLKQEDIEFQVVKNSLLTRASQNSDVEFIKDYFKGPSAVVFGYNDTIAPAKILTEFIKEKENESFKIKVGVMDGKVIDSEAIKVMASLPSREALLSSLLSVLNGVPTSFVRVLNSIPQEFVNVIMAIKKQKESTE